MRGGPRASECVPARELSPPCLASEGRDRNGPPAGPSEAPVSDCLCFWATSSPVDVGLLLWPASLMEENTGLQEMF